MGCRTNATLARGLLGVIFYRWISGVLQVLAERPRGVKHFFLFAAFKTIRLMRKYFSAQPDSPNRALSIATSGFSPEC
jgi:hypothetical protein